MTVVVGVQTTDGLVLASDSATTQTLPTVDGRFATSSIWNSANKIFNLRKTWPVGAMTFGLAAINGLSIATHAKNLRLRFEGVVGDPIVPKLDGSSYTMKDVADSVHAYFKAQYDRDHGGELGFLLGGFSADQQSPEMWQIAVTESGNDKIEQVLPPGEAGIAHQGMTDAITRLMDGAGQELGRALATLGVPEDDSEGVADELRSHLSMPWAWPGMPLGETIDMARFLVDTQINFIRFVPGDAIVGGPVEVAALTKHEGFKWVQRKHYYPADLNAAKDVNA